MTNTSIFSCVRRRWEMPCVFQQDHSSIRVLVGVGVPVGHGVYPCLRLSLFNIWGHWEYCHNFFQWLKSYLHPQKTELCVGSSYNSSIPNHILLGISFKLCAVSMCVCVYVCVCVCVGSVALSCPTLCYTWYFNFYSIYTYIHTHIQSFILMIFIGLFIYFCLISVTFLNVYMTKARFTLFVGSQILR